MDDYNNVYPIVDKHSMLYTFLTFQIVANCLPDISQFIKSIKAADDFTVCFPNHVVMS